MLPDLSLTISGTTSALPRISSEANTGIFSTPDGALKIKAAHQYGRVRRSLFRLDYSKFAADPLIPAQNVPVSASFWWSVIVPRNGSLSSTEQLAIVKGFNAMMAASTDSTTIKWLGGEN